MLKSLRLNQPARTVVETCSFLQPKYKPDLKTMAGLEAALPTYTTVQLLIPVLAHAAGTLVAALIVARWGLWPVFSAYLFAGLFFLGGLQMVFALPEIGRAHV